MTQAQMTPEPDWRRRKKLGRWASLRSFAVAVVFVMPLVWMLSSSLKPSTRSSRCPPA